jgi:hypothetical protein
MAESPMACWMRPWHHAMGSRFTAPGGTEMDVAEHRSVNGER